MSSDWSMSRVPCFRSWSASVAATSSMCCLLRLAGSRSKDSRRRLPSRWLHSASRYVLSKAVPTGTTLRSPPARRKRSWRRSTTTKNQTLEVRRSKREQSTGEYSGAEEEQRTGGGTALVGRAADRTRPLGGRRGCHVPDGEHHSSAHHRVTRQLPGAGDGHQLVPRPRRECVAVAAAHRQRLHHRRGPGADRRLAARILAGVRAGAHWHAEGRIHRGIRQGGGHYPARARSSLLHHP